MGMFSISDNLVCAEVRLGPLTHRVNNTLLFSFVLIFATGITNI
jgi:hypothetical protein